MTHTGRQLVKQEIIDSEQGKIYLQNAGKRIDEAQRLGQTGLSCVEATIKNVKAVETKLSIGKEQGKIIR